MENYLNSTFSQVMHDENDITPDELKRENGVLKNELFQLRGLKESLLLENKRLKELLSDQIERNNLG